MASYSVQYIFSLIDKFSPGTQKMSAAAQSMSKAVHAAGRAASSAAAGIKGYGAAAANAARQVAALAREQRAIGRGGIFGSGGRRGGGLSVMGGIGSLIPGFTLLKVLQQAREASKAENKFRSLVDSVTDTEMSELKQKIQKQMRYTGEKFSDLMDATGEAAQIVGKAGLAGDITMAASSLAKIDTAKKDTGYFADAVAAIVGKDASDKDVNRLADMLAAQQKLGAATAGGTIEAYKNVVLEKQIRKFDPVEMITAIGLIKNISPATQDSQIGNMAKYGMRVLSSPNDSMTKQMDALGLTPKSFETDGKFDIGKTQKLFHDMTQSAVGLQKFKDLFSGKNVLAGQFWSALASVDPKEFERYKNALTGSDGELWKSMRERLQGLDGALTRLEGAGFSAALAIGQWLTPAIMTLADWAEKAVDLIGPMLTEFSTNYPTMSKWASMALIAAAGLSMLAIPLAAIGLALRMLGARALVGILGGVISGVAGGIASVIGIGSALYRVAGAASLAKFALRSAFRIVGIGLLIEGLIQAYQHWDQLKAIAANPIELKVLWPEMPGWLKYLLDGADAENKRVQQGIDEKLGNFGSFENAIDGVANASAAKRAVDRANLAGRAAAGDPMAQFPYVTTPEQGWYDRMTGASPYNWDGAFSAAQPQASQIPQSISVQARTSFDPATINVNVTGQVNGPLNGTGSGTLQARPSRGEATSSAGASSPAYDNPGGGAP